MKVSGLELVRAIAGYAGYDDIDVEPDGYGHFKLTATGKDRKFMAKGSLDEVCKRFVREVQWNATAKERDGT